MDQQKPPAISSNYVPFTFQKVAGIPEQNQQQQQNKNTSSLGSAGTDTSTSNMAAWFGTTTTGGDCGSGSIPKSGLGWGSTTPATGLGWGGTTTTTTPAIRPAGWGATTTTTTPAIRPGWGATTITPATGLTWGGPTTSVGGNDYNQLKVAALEVSGMGGTMGSLLNKF